MILNEQQMSLAWCGDFFYLCLHYSFKSCVRNGRRASRKMGNREQGCLLTSRSAHTCKSLVGLNIFRMILKLYCLRYLVCFSFLLIIYFRSPLAVLLATLQDAVLHLSYFLLPELMLCLSELPFLALTTSLA